MQVGPNGQYPPSEGMQQENLTNTTKKRKLPTPKLSSPESSQNKSPLNKKVKLEKESSTKTSNLGPQSLLKGKEKEKEKEKEIEVEGDKIIRQLNIGELGVRNLTEEQETLLMNCSSFFRMIFSQGASANESKAEVQFTGEEQAPIRDKLIELIDLALNQKPYLDHASIVEWEKVEKEQEKELDKGEVFNDLILMREAAIYLGMDSYIQEANKFCLEIILNNSNPDQKIQQLAHLVQYGNFTPQEYEQIYKLSLDWDDLMQLYSYSLGFRSEEINSIFKFLNASAKNNPTIEHTLDYSKANPDFEAQILQMINLCPNLKELKIISPDSEGGELPEFDEDYSYNLERLEIEKLFLDHTFQDAYDPITLKKNFPHLRELHIVDVKEDIDERIICRKRYNDFISLQKIYLYFYKLKYDSVEKKFFCEKQLYSVYERSPKTQKFVNIESAVTSSESSEDETSEFESFG